jgi:hypothetical protein
MSKKDNKAATAAIATVASVGAHIAVSPVPHTANVGKYGKAAAHVPCASQLFRIAKGDGALFAATGRNKAGRYTVQALVCMAARLAGATADKPATGMAIVTAMQTHADILEGLRHCKATKYAAGGKVPCALWANDYVTGCARGASPLLARTAS